MHTQNLIHQIALDGSSSSPAAPLSSEKGKSHYHTMNTEEIHRLRSITQRLNKEYEAKPSDKLRIELLKNQIKELQYCYESKKDRLNTTENKLQIAEAKNKQLEEKITALLQEQPIGQNQHASPYKETQVVENESKVNKRKRETVKQKYKALTQKHRKLQNLYKQAEKDLAASKETVQNQFMTISELKSDAIVNRETKEELHYLQNIFLQVLGEEYDTENECKKLKKQVCDYAAIIAKLLESSEPDRETIAN